MVGYLLEVVEGASLVVFVIALHAPWHWEVLPTGYLASSLGTHEWN